MRSSRIPACSSSGEISPSLFVSRAFGSSKCGPRRFASAAGFGVGSGLHATSEPRSTSDTTFMGPRLAHARAGGVPTQFLSIPTQTEIISSQRAAYRPRMKRLLLAFVLACGGSSSPPAQTPADKPPLPPASGTPIGYLIDDASELHLRDDQLTQLRQLDTQLAADLDALDTRIRAAQPSQPQAKPQMGGMGGGRHRGGRGRRGGAQQAQHAASTGDPGAADKLTEQRRAG